MDLVPVDRLHACEDAVNVNGLATVPVGLLTADIEHWYGRIADKDRPLYETKSIATLFNEGYTPKTAQLGELAITAVARGRRDQETEQHLVAVAARYALSRLVGVLVKGDRTFSDDSNPYRGTPGDKLLIESDPGGVAPGACGVIVDKDLLSGPPFTGENFGWCAGVQWYRSGDLSIYVAATYPASASKSHIQSMRQTTGSLEETLRIIDSASSVRLEPYLSHAFLKHYRD